MHAIIPPDALYGSVEKRPKFAYVDAADFNDSKVRKQSNKFVSSSSNMYTLKVRILEQQSSLMNNGVQHRHCHTLVLGRNGKQRSSKSGTNMAVGPPYLHHTFSRRQHQLQQLY